MYPGSSPRNRQLVSKSSSLTLGLGNENDESPVKWPSHSSTVPPKFRPATSFGSNATEPTCASSQYTDSQYDRSPSSRYSTMEEHDNDDDEDADDQAHDSYSVYGDDMSCIQSVNTPWDDSSSSESMVAGHVEDDRHNQGRRQLQHQQPQPNLGFILQKLEQKTPLIDETKGAVCFGWIKHETTELWRVKVKIFSDNRTLYPSWNKSICRQVLALLEQEGVVRFLVCRGNHATRDKIHKKGDSAGSVKWRPATDKEVLEKTKQRFTDDRKPSPPPKESPAGEKPRRGRPKNSKNRDAAAGEQSPREAASPNSVVPWIVQEMFAKCRSSIQTVLATKRMDPGDATRLSELRQQLSQVAQDMDCIQKHVNWAQLENVPAFALDLPKMPDLKVPLLEEATPKNEPAQTLSDDLNTPIGTALCSERELWYPIESNNVCFEWNNHYGTDRWNQVVKEMAENTKDYPEWNDYIGYVVRERLSEEGIDSFCSFLDSEGKNSQSILQGLWYGATDDEVMEKTKQEFLRHRLITEELSNFVFQTFGKPSAGGSNGSNLPPEDAEDSDDQMSGGEDQDMSGHDSSGSSTGHGFGYQNALSLAPAERIVKFSTPLVTSTNEPQGVTEKVPTTADGALDKLGASRIPDKLQSRLPTSSVPDGNPEDDCSSVGTDSDKVYVNANDPDVFGSSLHTCPMLMPEQLKEIENNEHNQTSVWLSMRVNQLQLEPQFDGSELTKMQKTQGEKNSTPLSSAATSNQKLVILPQTPLASTTSLSMSKGPKILEEADVMLRPGAIRVSGGSDLQWDSDDLLEHPDEETETAAQGLVEVAAYVVNNTRVMDNRGNNGESSVAFGTAPTSEVALSIPDRLKPLCELMARGEAYTIISEKLVKTKWRRLLTSLDAQEFGSLIANIKMDSDRPRVAELLAGRMLDEQGAQGFTCEHAALAIKNTQFRGIMAERILPYCVDISSNISIVKKELQDWDVSLLLLSLCRKVQSSALSAVSGLIDPVPRRSIRQRLRASLSFLNKSLRRRPTTVCTNK